MRPHLIVILSVSILSVLSEQTLPNDQVQKQYDVVPRKYDVKLFIDTIRSSNEEFLLLGNVCIRIECINNVKKIKLHGKGKNGNLELREDAQTKAITITSLPANAGKPIKVEQHDYDEESDILTIDTEELISGKLYELCIQYKGKISEENGYVILRKDDQSVKEYFIATNFQRQSAFPCFDEPNMIAKFNIQLKVLYAKGSNYPKTYGNDLTKKTTKRSKSLTIIQDTYIIDKNVSPSQISFVVTNMMCEKKRFSFSRKIKPYFISCRDKSNEFKNVRIKDLKNKMKFSLAFSNNYPKTIRFIVIPTKEKLISWKLGLVLISKEEVTDNSDGNIMYNVMIRLTSQLFGGMINPESWESNWLFTALAKFCAYLQKLNYFQDRALMMELPSNDLDINMSKGVDNFQQEIFGELKGLFIIRMIYSVMSHHYFKAAIEYLSEHFEYKQPPGSKEVWRSFDDETEVLPYGINSWNEVIEKWKTQPSYPVVTVTSLGDGQFELTQEYFIGIYDKKRQYEISKSQNNGEKLCWMIPFSHSKFDPNESKSISYEFHISIKWLECDVNKKTVLYTGATGDQLVLFNMGYRGLYRVKYDETSLEKIVKTLETSRNSIRPIARAQLVHDALTLAWMGYQDYKLVFSLLKLLVNEHSDLVWKAFFSGVFNLNEILKTSPETYRLFQDYVESIMTDTFHNKYGERRIVSNLLEKEQSVIFPRDVLFHFWGCNVARIELCRIEAAEVYVFWMSKTQDQVLELFKKYQQSTSLISTTLCSVIDNKHEYHGEAIEKVDYFFEILMNHGEENMQIKYQEEYINILGCISDSSVVDRFLDKLMSPDPKPMVYHGDGHKENVFLKLIDNPHTFLPTLKYFYKKINEILIYIPGKEVRAKLVKAFTSKMQLNQISEMKDFVKAKPELKTTEVLQAIEEGEAVANRRGEWLEKNDLHIRTALTTFLNDQIK